MVTSLMSLIVGDQHAPSPPGGPVSFVWIFNHDHRTTFSRMFTGPGEDSAHGTGRVIAQFEMAGDGRFNGARTPSFSPLHRSRAMPSAAVALQVIVPVGGKGRADCDNPRLHQTDPRARSRVTPASPAALLLVTRHPPD